MPNGIQQCWRWDVWTTHEYNYIRLDGPSWDTPRHKVIQVVQHIDNVAGDHIKDTQGGTCTQESISNCPKSNETSLAQFVDCRNTGRTIGSTGQSNNFKHCYYREGYETTRIVFLSKTNNNDDGGDDDGGVCVCFFFSLFTRRCFFVISVVLPNCRTTWRDEETEMKNWYDKNNNNKPSNSLLLLHLLAAASDGTTVIRDHPPLSNGSIRLSNSNNNSNFIASKLRKVNV